MAGIGGLSNGAKRNAKADQLRPVPRHNVNKENESNEDTEPRHCRNILLATCALLLSRCKSDVKLSLGCPAIELIVTVHGCPFAIHLLIGPETLL